MGTKSGTRMDEQARLDVLWGVAQQINAAELPPQAIDRALADFKVTREQYRILLKHVKDEPTVASRSGATRALAKVHQLAMDYTQSR